MSKITVVKPGGDNFPFDCPEEMVPFQQMVFEGEYNFNYPGEPRAVLDIGGNCGAFALWAAERWPSAEIHSYEPAQVAYSYLERNCAGHPRIKHTRAAIVASEKTKLYVGKQNQGEASFCPDLGQTLDTYELPPLLHPKELPQADILKVDTEGCEIEIIAGILAVQQPQLIMFEYHREADRKLLDVLMEKYTYGLAGGQIMCFTRGTLKYLRGKQ